MIMFRKKIDPRTTVTISQALPKIIITLILITFSYPIAGILFDVMNIGKQVSYTIMSQPLYDVLKDKSDFKIGGNEIRFPSDFKAFDIWTVFGVGGGLKELLNLGEIRMEILGYNPEVGFILGLVFGILLLSIAFKVLITLITYYVRFFLLTITAPLTFLWGTLPGQEEHTSHWFMQFITTSVVFVTIYLMMNLAYFFYLYAEVSGLTVEVPPVLGDIDTTAVGKLMAFGILLALPSIPEAIENALAPTKRRGKPLGEELAGGFKKIPIIGGLVG